MRRLRTKGAPSSSRTPTAPIISNPSIGVPAGEPIFIDDFGALETSGKAVAAARGTLGAQAPGKWRLERGAWGARQGQLLHGVPTDKPATLSFDLPRGAYSISLGAYSPNSRQFGLYVRLSDQPHFTYLQMEQYEASFEEIRES